MIFIFLGPPGSGKGTQAQIAAERHGIPALSTGEILRQKAAEDSESGRQLAEVMASGKLVDTLTVNQIVVEALAANDAKGMILDGYPRNLLQAEFLAQKDVPATILFFDVKDEILVKRLSGRFACEGCGKLYNKYFAPTSEEGICDSCGATEFIYRSDDTQQSIIRRLQEYKAETFELIEYYQAQEMLNKIDASEPVEKISSQVEECMKNALTS